jgi:hypothetical protein
VEVPVPVKPARVTLETTVGAAAVAPKATANRATTAALEPTVSSRCAAVVAPPGRVPNGGEPQRESDQDGEGCAYWLHVLETLQGAGHILDRRDSGSAAYAIVKTM